MPTTPSQQDRRIEAEFVTLRDYIDTRLEALDKEREAAYKSMEKRLDGMNEFRETLRDQSSMYLTKVEYCVFKESIEKDIRALLNFRATLEGKASQSSVVLTLLISVAGLIMGLISLFMKAGG